VVRPHTGFPDSEWVGPVGGAVKLEVLASVFRRHGGVGIRRDDGELVH
jgi:hypothetical protein